MQNNIFNNWSIEKGDYKRDETATRRYERKLRLKKNIKKIFFVSIYLLIVALITYFLLS